MITVNSLSAGESSSYMAVKYRANRNVFALVCIDDKKCAPKDKSIIDYVNFKLGDRYINRFGEFIATAEDDKSLYAMRDLEQILGQNIDWVRGKSFDQVIDGGTQTRLPSWARRYCTEQMKLLSIFMWWFYEIGQKVDMRIGFRFDEFSRMERFFNFSDPTNFSIPTQCRTYGQKLQRHENFNWRYCSFPMVRDGITKAMVKDYWKNNGWIGGQFFEERRQIKFPKISNCVGCFHKKPETLAIQANLNPDKMKWFSDQENKDMGTWLDSKITYQTIMDNAGNWIPEMLLENASCDSGGCTD